MDFSAGGKTGNTYGCPAASVRVDAGSEPDEKREDDGIERVRVVGKHLAFENR